MHIQAWIWWQGILLQSQFSLFLCILKPEAYAQKLDRSKTPAQLHIMNWHPDIKDTSEMHMFLQLLDDASDNSKAQFIKDSQKECIIIII